MNYLEKLLRAEAAGIVALFICASLMGLYGYLESYVWSLKGSKLIFTPLDASWLTFAYTGSIGLVAVLFYGAPVYALLSYKRLVFWWSVILVGAAPGAVIMFLDSNLGGWLLVLGIFVALISHFLNIRFVPYKMSSRTHQ
jgi:hypothetical protein